jgi:hypothetical protein
LHVDPLHARTACLTALLKKLPQENGECLTANVVQLMIKMPHYIKE